MPQKRTPPAGNPSSPPTPGSNSNVYLHHSPIAGRLQDLPVDSAAASASPQTKRFKENEMPPIPSSPNQSPEASGQLPEATDLLTSQPTAAAGGRSMLAVSPIANGGNPILPAPIQRPISTGQLAATETLASHSAAAAGEGMVVPSSPIPNGGARAQYAAAQQQRTVTCNLSLIPPSKVTSCRQSQP